MDAADATTFGAWASIRGYFTPATLFLVVNIVIGTIALTSRSHQRRRREDHHDDGLHHRQVHHQEQQQHPRQQQQEEEYQHHYYQQQPQYATPAPAPAPAPLARTSSVLDRLRSIGLYRFRSGDFPPEYGAANPAAQDVFSPVEEETAKQAQYARSRSEPAPAREEKRAASRMKKSGSEARKAQAVRPPPARVVEAVAVDDAVEYARAEEFIGSFRRPEPSPQLEQYYPEEYVPPRAPVHAPLARTSSVLDRLRSIGLYGFLAPEQPAAATTPAAGEKKQAHYDRSRSEPAKEQQGMKEKKQAAEARMAKSSSAARKAAAPGLAEEECVNARAEAFIDNFRPDRSEQRAPPRYQEEHTVPPPASAPLARTSSVLDRLHSFGLYLRSGDLLGPEDPVPEEEEKQQQQAHYVRSRSEPAREQGKKEEKKKQGAAAEVRMSKSSSEAGIAEVEEAAVAEVDERADDFINKFRQQLQLQRLNSLLNYKEMLGGSKQQQ